MDVERILVAVGFVLLTLGHVCFKGKLHIAFFHNEHTQAGIELAKEVDLFGESFKPLNNFQNGFEFHMLVPSSSLKFT